MGTDLLFWHHYTRTFKGIILKDHYIPALKYHKTGKKNGSEIYPTWEIVSEKYNSEIKTYISWMPLVCAAGFEAPNDKLEFYSKEALLRHFSEYILYEIVTCTPFTGQFEKLIDGTLISDCLSPRRRGENLIALGKEKAMDDYQKWSLWRERLTGASYDTGFNLCFQLIEAPAAKPDKWQIDFLVSSKKDPSYKVALADYWYRDKGSKKEILKHLGTDFEKQLLLNLGYAARIYPKVWDGLETDKPGGLKVNLDEAFGFLNEAAWILEDAGYKIIIPSWWTPAGRRKAKVRLRTSSHAPSSTKAAGAGYFSLQSIIKYQYSLSIGGEIVTEEEWKELVGAKTPLVHFRGAWIELDRDKMKQMLEFWQSHAQEKPEINLLDMMKMASQQEEELEFEHHEALSEMMEKLHDKSRLDIIEDPPQFNGTLREYQKRGVSWLTYLEGLGCNSKNYFVTYFRNKILIYCGEIMLC